MKIGLFGGTFNPVHRGHLLLAEGAQRALGLDRLLWVVSGIPPHKVPDPLIAPEHRYEMVRLAVAGQARFEPSRIEMDQPGPSYTIDTVRRLQAGPPGRAAEWFLLVGSDSAGELPTWKSFESLKAMVQIVVIPRPDLPGAQAPAGVRTIAVTTLPISSSQIRQRVREGLPIEELVPEAVARYIAARGLYREVAG
ncbi:MAG: nicotinate (nicotinamide) nucleotide adenylyltransferase [Candidatus Omnitrophica bacterium]|nr:nicotinate (nicotinamide) nucleotide adenylyltransferase [Candidatus Omnitrophota bacterium]